jgi:hypothetical protein
MSTTTTPRANVYHLPAPPVLAPPPPPPTPARALWRRLRAFGWRLRFTGAEIVATLRRFGRPSVDVDAAQLEHRLELTLAALRPSVGPAQVIDFAAARARLRA